MKQQINEIRRMQQLAGLIKENEEYGSHIVKSLEGLTKMDIKDIMAGIQDEVYSEATPEEIAREERSVYGGDLDERCMERFEITYGVNYWDALDNAPDKAEPGID